MRRIPRNPVSRALALALFRVHIENGLLVALGVGLTGLVVGGAVGFAAAIAASTGAFCVSVSDQPDPLSHKPWVMGFGFGLTVLFTAVASFAGFHPWSILAATSLTGIFTGVVSAYGKRALSLSMTAVLAFVFAMGQHFAGAAQAWDHLGWIGLGGALYAVYGVIAAWALDDRIRRLLLAEAMRGFAAWLRAKAALYNPDAEGGAAFHGLIDAHASLAERVQAARDSLFARRRSRLQLKRIDTLIALLDAFETMLAADADLELLRRSGRREIKWRVNALLLHAAERVEELTLALRKRRVQVPARGHGQEADALVTAVMEANCDAPEEPAMDHAFSVTAEKLMLGDRAIAALAGALDRNAVPSQLAQQLDLNAFRARLPDARAFLASQMDFKAPALRFGIRLALAMTTGLVLTLAFPQIAHANWVLLTTALIMRANYSVTSQRRWDRVTGTLVGCALAVGMILVFPDNLLLAAIVISVGISHAYVAVRYRITAICASITALLLLHFSTPSDHPQFFERIVDTLIGAGLSWGFSFLLPNWEISALPRIIKSLLAADAGFAGAAIRRTCPAQTYRLARKKALDAVALLSGAIRRLADEPHLNRRMLAALNELLGANYVLAADLASIPILMRLRGEELEHEADGWIGSAREWVMARLAGGARPEAKAEIAVPAGSVAMGLLARRLEHIEQSAEKVARLAARPVIEEKT